MLVDVPNAVVEQPVLQPGVLDDLHCVRPDAAGPARSTPSGGEMATCPIS
jgi:hypothetical protein